MKEHNELYTDKWNENNSQYIQLLVNSHSTNAYWSHKELSVRIEHCLYTWNKVLVWKWKIIDVILCLQKKIIIRNV